jgi:hypothetical protein
MLDYLQLQKEIVRKIKKEKADKEIWKLLKDQENKFKVSR